MVKSGFSGPRDKVWFIRTVLPILFSTVVWHWKQLSFVSRSQRGCLFRSQVVDSKVLLWFCLLYSEPCKVINKTKKQLLLKRGYQIRNEKQN